MKIITFLLVSSIALCFLVVQVHSFASPFLGVGALFFKPKGMTIQSLDDLEKRDAAILEAGRFFVDAFWAGKGGNKVVFSPKKRKSLESQQMAEFRRRYLMRSSKTQSDLIVAKSGDGEIMGCAGIEVNLIKSPNSMSDSITAPLMVCIELYLLFILWFLFYVRISSYTYLDLIKSNVAVGRNFRRRGIAEDLIKETENIVSAWGYEGKTHIFICDSFIYS